MKGEFHGGCRCGAVTFTARVAALGANHCHCRSCRKMSGALAMTWATFPADAVSVAGETKDDASSADVRWTRCASCGSLLFWRRLGRDTIDIAFGAIDDPGDLVPSNHIWTSHRVARFTLDPELPEFPERGA